MHTKGSYKPKDLDTVPEYKAIISETNNILSSVFKDNDLSEGMLESLENDVFLFSSLKTHAQLFEASRLLLTEDKTIKSYAVFENDVKSIKSNYNENYLEAEYNFAVGSVQMVERWDTYIDDEETYSVQYKTDGGPNVRDSHNALNLITLPKSDPFWDSYTPLNGWHCHCFTKQVLKFRYPTSDSAEALKNGEKATTQLDKDGNNKLAIFRFNPAKQKVVFPPKHPYRKIQGANKIIKK